MRALDLTFPLASILRIQGYDRLLFQWWWLLFPLAALMIALALWKVVVLLAIWLRKPSDCPTKLFRKLTKSHRLSRQERQMLQMLQRNLPPEIPAPLLFVEPTSWEWTKSFEARMMERAEKLFLKIFGFAPDRMQAK